MMPSKVAYILYIAYLKWQHANTDTYIHRRSICSNSNGLKSSAQNQCLQFIILHSINLGKNLHCWIPCLFMMISGSSYKTQYHSQQQYCWLIEKDLFCGQWPGCPTLNNSLSHCKHNTIPFRRRNSATLGSILNFQQNWKYGKFQLVRWSQEMALFPVNIPPPPNT